jgi:hypothetical protein
MDYPSLRSLFCDKVRTIKNDCLIGRELIRYVGSSAPFCVGSDILSIGPRSFKRRALVFSPNPQLNSLLSFGVSSCDDLRSVPNSIDVICEECFSSCSQLTSVSFAFPAAIPIIDSGAFSHCARLSSFILPFSVYSAFLHCPICPVSSSRLTSIPNEPFFLRAGACGDHCLFGLQWPKLRNARFSV